MATLKEMILSTEDFQLVRRGSTPKETLMAAYAVAQEGSGCTGLKETPAAMFSRTGRFCTLYRATLGLIASEIYVEIGLAGGVVPGTLADIEYLPINDARKLTMITLAQHESETIMQDLLKSLAAWAAKAPPPHAEQEHQLAEKKRNMGIG